MSVVALKCREIDKDKYRFLRKENDGENSAKTHNVALCLLLLSPAWPKVFSVIHFMGKWSGTKWGKLIFTDSIEC